MGYMVHCDWGKKQLQLEWEKISTVKHIFLSLTSLDPPDPVTYAEIIGAKNLTPDSTRIKSDLITIPHL